MTTGTTSSTPSTTVPTHDQVFPPETLLKKRKTASLQTAAKAQAQTLQTAASETKRAVIFSRAEQYVKEYLDTERETIRLKRQAKAEGAIFVPPQEKLVFVIRIKGINKIAPKPRKVLQLLRLLQVNNGVFIRLTSATAELLRLIEPYVTYGCPSLASVRKLVYKRGYGKVNKQRVALTDNHIVERELGQFGIICVEDVVHELFTVGPNFKQVSNFLWPFKLANPTGGWGVRRKFKHFVEGGALGDREDNINALIEAQN